MTTFLEYPTRKKNIEYRSREHLTLSEVKALISAARERGRHPHRDYTLLLLMFRHGLRVSEACDLRWDAIIRDRREIYINRLKGSLNGKHRLQPDEMEALARLKEIYPNRRYLFANERGEHLTRAAVQKIISRAGIAANLCIKVHPHMLRHACGYHMAEQGMPTRDIQAYLGHTNIQHTVRYTAENPSRFDRMDWTWNDEEIVSSY